MPRAISSILIILVGCAAAFGQAVCSRSSGTPMDMQVRLSIEEKTLLSQGSNNNGIAGAGNDSSHGHGATGENRQEFGPDMQIRIELQDNFGARLQELTPSSEGKATFRVCSRASYRLRVIGTDIEESTTENIEPGRGDRLVNIALHRKGDKADPKTKGLIAASRLKIPRQAQKDLQRGNAALSAGRLPEARQSYENAVAEYPQFDQAYNNLGVTLMQMGDATGGRAAFEKAVAINDHFARALSNLAKLAIDDRQYEKALEYTRRSLAVEPLNPHALMLAVEAAYFAGSYDESATRAAMLHTLPHAGMALAHYFSARSLEKLGLKTRAIDEYQLFLTEDPTNPNVPQARMAITELKASAPVN